jgi:hypothetical protein
LVYFRDSWLCSVLKSVPKDDAYEHLSKSLELTRVHLLDIVTQYRALFPGNKKTYLTQVHLLRGIVNWSDATFKTNNVGRIW